MFGDEIDEQLVHHIGHVFLVLQGDGFAVEQVFLPFRLRVPIDAASLVGQVGVEAEIRGGQTELRPFADRGGGITG